MTSDGIGPDMQTRLAQDAPADDGAHDHPLRVALHARDPGRLGALLADLATEGIVAEGGAGILLADLAPGEAPPDDGSATLLLTDDPALARDSDTAGVLPRTASAGQVAAALRAVAAGLFVRARAAEPGFATSDEPEPPPLLTPRELEILRAIGEGMSNKAVARLLGISAHTVKFHLEAVFAKLAARTRAEAVAKGLRQGLIEV